MAWERGDAAARGEEARRWYDLLSLVLGFCLVFGIVKLLVVTIEDHID